MINTHVNKQATEPCLLTDTARALKHEFLWIPHQFAAERNIDWTVKALVCLAASVTKLGGDRGLIATDSELTDFLCLQGKRQLYKVINRALALPIKCFDRKHTPSGRRILLGGKPPAHSTGIKIRRRVYRNRELNWTQKAAYAQIENFVHAGNTCYVSSQWLAEHLGISRSHARKVLKQLKGLKYLAMSYSDGKRYLCPTSKLDSQDQVPCSSSSVPCSITLPPPQMPCSSTYKNIYIKESEKISAGAENLFLPTTSDNVPIDSSNKSTRWNPLTDYEWQYKLLKRYITDLYRAMQKEPHLIDPRKPLVINDEHLRGYLNKKCTNKLLMHDTHSGFLNFTAEVGEFVQLLTVSWAGMSQITQCEEEYNIWLPTKNTNDVSTFVTRYGLIKKNLGNERCLDQWIHEATHEVNEKLLHYFMQHNWAKRWNPKGDLLTAEIDPSVLNQGLIKHADDLLHYDTRMFMNRVQNGESKEDAVKTLSSRTSAWLILNGYGLFDAAQEYAPDAMDTFRRNPEILYVYRKYFPKEFSRS